MFQIKFQCGYEIQVIGKGENGSCRVCNSNQHVVFRGTYAECERWLTSRAVRSLLVPRRV